MHPFTMTVNSALSLMENKTKENKAKQQQKRCIANRDFPFIFSLNSKTKQRIHIPMTPIKNESQ